MDCFDDYPFEVSSKDDEKVENNNVDNLLEEGWFYGKFLTSSRPRMLRSYSDPSPNFDQQILADKFTITNSSSSSKKVVAGSLIRAPSLPPFIGRREENIEDKERRMRSKLTRQLSDLGLVQESSNVQACIGKVESIQYKARSKIMSTGQSSKHKLLRTPSLPRCIGREELGEENESDITMSRLIRAAMPISYEILPPSLHPSKDMVQNCSTTKYKPPSNLKNLRYSNQRSLKKCLSNLESKEVQGFKDLGFTFNKKDLNPSAGLQCKKQQNPDEDKLKRPYLSEAWHGKGCAPPLIPIWANKNSAEDMKLQLKCWARAVASNVR